MENKGLGDTVEEIIKKVAPKFAERKKNCKSCKRRKTFLNNIGAKFG